MNNQKRKPNRLQNYDYSQAGYYFVTICTQNRVNYFGKIERQLMHLNEIGEIVKNQWVWLSTQYDYVELDTYIVMPNHLHGILIIRPCRDRSRPVSTGTKKIKSLSELIGAFKTTSSKQIHKYGLSRFKWQRSFYDHIIRNEKSLDNIRAYIQNNPLNWELDKNNPRTAQSAYKTTRKAKFP